MSSSSSGQINSTPRHYAASETVADWPLKFAAHNFGGHCFDTQACEISYQGFLHGAESPSPSLASYERDLDELLSAGRGPIKNFPPPAEVKWRSKNGSEHHASIDIAEIFKDQLIRHNVSKEDIPPDAGFADPDIILEVNDRTINVYMRAFISLKAPRDPGNPNSDYRDELIKVFSRTY